MKQHNLRWLATFVAGALVLAGCAQIPTSGDVVSQDISVPEIAPINLTATGPAYDASPEQIVEGFIAAQAAGLGDDRSVARDFLTPSAANKWQADLQTTVFTGDLLVERADPNAQVQTPDPVGPDDTHAGDPTGATSATNSDETNGQAQPSGESAAPGSDTEQVESTAPGNPSKPSDSGDPSDPGNSTDPVAPPDPNRITVAGTFGVSATVTQTGVYTEALPGAQAKVNFDLVRNAQGQWRIETVADGNYMSATHFLAQFRATSLYFLSADAKFLVPEVRWYWRNRAETLAVNGLLAGPSEWLRDSLVTDIPSGTRLMYDSVSVDDVGTAHVNLSPELLSATGQHRENLTSQIHATLLKVPGVRTVDIQVNAVEFAQTPNEDLIKDPIVASAPMVLQDGTLSNLVGRTIEPIADFGSLAGLDVTGLALDDSQGFGVMRLGTSKIVALPGPTGHPQGPGTESVTDPDANSEQGSDPESGAQPDGEGDPATGDTTESEAATELPDSTDPAGPPVTPPGTLPGDPAAKATVLMKDSHLVAPSIDRFGWIWSGKTPSPGFLRTALRDGTQVEVAAPWLAERTIVAVRISHDGSRAAIISADGDQTQIEVAAIIRDPSNLPLSLGTPITVGSALVGATLMQWTDEATLAVIAHSATSDVDTLFTVTVGGRSEMISNVEGATSMGAGRGLRSLYIGTQAGEILSRTSTGASWAVVLEDAFYPTFPG